MLQIHNSHDLNLYYKTGTTSGSTCQSILQGTDSLKLIVGLVVVKPDIVDSH